MSTHYSSDDSVAYTERNSLLESQPLISPLSQQMSRILYPLVRRLCITSKPVFLILLLTVIIGSVHFFIMGAAIGVLMGVDALTSIDGSLPIVIVYFIAAVVLVFYPVNGFLADVYCGRRNVIFISLCLILFSFINLLLFVLLVAYYNIHPTIPLYIIGYFVLVIVVIGVAGYGANFIQFGLDQLLEAPSQDQALFVHWAKWCYDFLSTVILLVLSLHSRNCIIYRGVNHEWVIIICLILFIVSVLLISIIFSCWKRHWFYTESRRDNPYKVVAKVLSFAWNHKYPLQRSAFTYCDNEKPSRLDFAKERFGGPFSTEQVEDVKVLLRIVLVLLAIGPVFSMDPLIDNLLLGIIGLHVGVESLKECDWRSFVTNAGILRFAVCTVIFPVYIWFIFSLFHNRVPRMLNRIGCGIFLYFMGTLSMLAVDSIGHSINNSLDGAHCIDHFRRIPSLGMHWSVMIPPVIFLGIGPALVTATVFEFISAQSPLSMKGFLLGVFFAIRGIFHLFGSIAVFLFASQTIWESSMRTEHPPAISCLSRTLLFLSVVILISLLLFLVAAKRYKHRERGDRPYDQRFAVDYYSRVIENRERDT